MLDFFSFDICLFVVEMMMIIIIFGFKISKKIVVQTILKAKLKKTVAD